MLKAHLNKYLTNSVRKWKPRKKKNTNKASVQFIINGSCPKAHLEDNVREETEGQKHATCDGDEETCIEWHLFTVDAGSPKFTYRRHVDSSQGGQAVEIQASCKEKAVKEIQECSRENDRGKCFEVQLKRQLDFFH